MVFNTVLSILKKECKNECTYNEITLSAFGFSLPLTIALIFALIIELKVALIFALKVALNDCTYYQNQYLLTNAVSVALTIALTIALNMHSLQH